MLTFWPPTLLLLKWPYPCFLLAFFLSFAFHFHTLSINHILTEFVLFWMGDFRIQISIVRFWSSIVNFNRQLSISIVNCQSQIVRFQILDFRFQILEFQIFFFFCRALKEFNQTDIRGTRFEELCPRPPPCDNFARFRTYDGSCNNLENPKFGWTFTPYQRILPNAYHDSKSQCLKITQNVAFELLYFGIFHHFLSY